MSVTPNFGWYKPVVGGDFGVWGTRLNETLDAIDAAVHTSQTLGVLIPQNFGAVGDGVHDDTAALQAWINAASFDTTEFGIGSAILPKGVYRITAPLSIPRARIHIVGEGRFQSTISFDGVAGGCLVWDLMPAANVTIEHIGIIGDTTSGVAIDLTNVQQGSDPVVYNGQMSNLNLIAGQQCILAPYNVFSYKFDTIFGDSFNNHVFQVRCGISVGWFNCYAGQCGAAGGGFAGFRLAGQVRLYNCNGINSGDYWGIFGADPAGVGDAAAYNGDFSVLTYPDIVLQGCNFEAYGVTALWSLMAFLEFKIQGGGFVRFLGANYHSDIRADSLFGGVVGCYMEIDAVRRITGGGVPDHKIFFDQTGSVLVKNDAFPAVWDVFWADTFALDYPTVFFLILQDEFDSRALDITRIQTDVAYVRDKLRVAGPIRLEGNFSTAGAEVRYIGTGTSADIWFYNVPTAGRHALAVHDVPKLEVEALDVKASTQIYSQRILATADAGTGVWVNDFSLGNNYQVKLRNGVNSPTISNVRDGAEYHMWLEQPAAGAAGTVTWFGGIRWIGGVAPVLTAVNGQVDHIILTYSANLGTYQGTYELNF